MPRRRTPLKFWSGPCGGVTSRTFRRQSRWSPVLAPPKEESRRKPEIRCLGRRYFLGCAGLVVRVWPLSKALEAHGKKLTPRVCSSKNPVQNEGRVWVNMRTSSVAKKALGKGARVQ